MKTGIELIAEERKRQVDVEGWSAEHDDKHKAGELALAGACYATPPGLGNGVPTIWPWDEWFWRPTPDNRIRELQKAGALIAAEIDRINRMNNK